MLESGIVRRVDKLGRLVIPAEDRHELGWNIHTQIEISRLGRYILLRRKDDREATPVHLARQQPMAVTLMRAIQQRSDQDCLLVLKVLQRLAESPSISSS